jgi:crotonobetainyl-CoA:carnitine CoA-transferase CaiB-like acyl-CoA transferase
MLLEGLRVLDLTRVLAGPLCTMMLADLGADVLKVERPGAGDDSRGWGPPFDDGGHAAYYLAVNRNKFSIALDFNDPGDRDLLRRLAFDADVVVENFRPRMLDRHGLGARRMLEEFPRLLWCTIGGFGTDLDRPAYDFTVQAESGWMSITGEPEGRPMKVGIALADVIAGKDAAALILGAVAARERGTLGGDVESRHLRVSLLHSATAALVNVAQNVLVSGRDAGRWGNAHANLCPYELFRTADGAVVIAVGSDAQWLACVRALGLQALADDRDLRSNPGRLAQRSRVVGTIGERVRTMTSHAVLETLRKAEVPCGEVRSVRQALAAVEASPGTGVHPLPPGTVRLPPPELDQHGALVRKLGWRAFD